MTNKEAIKRLNNCSCSDYMRKAIDLAIKALEREADLEQAVVNIKMSEEEIKQFKQMLQEHTPLYTITSDTFVEGASVNRPQGEWIPVSERLPEDMQRVLIWFEYNRYGDFNCMHQTYGFGYVRDGKWSAFINGETGWQVEKVIAWMPLPEAYKEKENE